MDLFLGAVYGLIAGVAATLIVVGCIIKRMEVSPVEWAEEGVVILDDLKCEECGPIRSIDEDGCCVTCGADTNYETLPLVSFRDPKTLTYLDGIQEGLELRDKQLMELTDLLLQAKKYVGVSHGNLDDSNLNLEEAKTAKKIQKALALCFNCGTTKIGPPYCGWCKPLVLPGDLSKDG